MMRNVLKNFQYSGVDLTASAINLDKRTVFTNTIALIGISITLPYTGIFLLAKQYLLSVLVIPVAVSYAICIFLNRKKHFSLAKLNFCLTANISILIFCSFLGRSLGIQNVAYAVAALSSVLFGLDQKKYIFIIFLSSVISLSFLEFTGYNFFQTIQFPELLGKSVYVTSLFVTLISLFLILRFYIVMSYRSEQKLKELNETLEHRVNEQVLEIREKNVLLEDLNKNLEDRVEAQVEQIREAESEKQKSLAYAKKVSELASYAQVTKGIAHEIFNPMLTLRIASKNMTNSIYNPGEAKEFVEIVSITANHVTQIVDSMLKYAESGASKPFTSISISEIISDISIILGAELKEKNIRLNLNFTDVPTVMGDSTGLFQIFSNLIRNSIEAIHENGEISISSNKTRFRDSRYQEKEGIEILFSDTGAGVSPEIAPVIFEAFKTNKDDVKNLGLGLSICMQIMERHHGIIECLPSEKGACFRLCFPTWPNTPEATKVAIPVQI